MPSPGLWPAPTTMATRSFRRISFHSRDRVLLEYLFVIRFVVCIVASARTRAELKRRIAGFSAGGLLRRYFLRFPVTLPPTSAGIALAAAYIMRMFYFESFQEASMILKSAFIAAVCTGVLALSGQALADDYRPDEFLGLDLSKAVLSPKRLGPPTQFAP